MTGTRAVQVVLGEGEPGNLRLVLEAQGFHVVGHARGDEELRAVVAVTHPSVIVLDAGISAVAMHEAQIRSDYAPIVVVWPKDTVTSVAEERVDPATAVLELGNAVRRVVARHAEPVPIADRDLDGRDVPRETTAPGSSVRRRPCGRVRHALVLVAAWTISLTALTAIGLAVPGALRALRPAGARHPSIDRPERGLTPDRERTTPRTVRTDGGSSSSDRGCAASNGPTSRGPASAKSDRPGRGCALGHGKRGTPGGRERGHGHGRPDDPGRGSGSDGDDGPQANGNGGPQANGDDGGSKDPKPEPDERDHGEGNDDRSGSDDGSSGSEGSDSSDHGGNG